MDPVSLGTLLSGISATNAGHSLLKALKANLKSGDIQPDEIAHRVAEIYDYVGEAKEALVNAKDEIAGLKEKIRDLERELKQRDEMKLAEGAGWTMESGPFCLVCLAENKRVEMFADGSKRGELPIYRCTVDRYGHRDASITLPSADINEARKTLVDKGGFPWPA